MSKRSQPEVISATADNDVTRISELLLDQAKRLKHVSEKDKEGNTALFYAARRGNILIMKLLLLANAVVDHVNRSGFTALHWASKFGQFSVVQLLIENNANVNATPCDSNLKAGPTQNMTPLFFAASRTDSQGKPNPATDIVDFLLKNKADPNKRPSNQPAPIHFYAAIAKCHVTVAALLLAGAKISLESPAMMTTTRQEIYYYAKKNVTILQYAKIIGTHSCLYSPVAAMVAEYVVNETVIDSHKDDDYAMALL